MERGGWATRGARLPNGTFAPDESAGDPANGEAVPRCRTCGLPGRSTNRLMDFELYLGRTWAGRYRLCERCFNRANPPPISDPLYTPENR